jgi:hypothetical protein
MAVLLDQGGESRSQCSPKIQSSANLDRYFHRNYKARLFRFKHCLEQGVVKTLNNRSVLVKPQALAVQGQGGHRPKLTSPIHEYMFSTYRLEINDPPQKNDMRVINEAAHRLSNRWQLK